jgi:hypothetical protein
MAVRVANGEAIELYEVVELMAGCQCFFDLAALIARELKTVKDCLTLWGSIRDQFNELRGAWEGVPHGITVQSVRRISSKRTIPLVPRCDRQITSQFAMMQENLGGCTPRFRHPQLNIQHKKVMPSTSNLFDRWDGKRLSQLLALFVSIALTPSMLLAEDENHMNGRDKVHDPTGAWLVRFLDKGDVIPTREFILIVFHKGGTLTQDLQGESGFDPSAVPLPKTDANYNNNVISSPSSGVWQKTGWNTFAGTLLDIEYHNAFNPALNLPPDVSVLQFGKLQFTGRLIESGDRMELSEVLTHFNPDGTLIPNATRSFPANGVRIPLEILPKTSDTLPIPQPPQ